MNEDIEKALKVLSEAVTAPASAPVDADEIREIVGEVLKADVFPVIGELGESVSELLDALDSKSKSARLPVARAVASGDNPILEHIAQYYTPEEENRKLVCMTAPPSYGKSYSVALLGESYDNFVEHCCSPDPEQWDALIGGASPKGKGKDGFMIVDGKVAHAVRRASKGESTLLFLDEVYRLEETAQQNMLTFLQPIKNEDGERVYRLTTKQNDGETFEVLEAPVSMLHVVCATNLSHEEPVNAFASRLSIKHFRYSADFITKIATSIAKDFGIADADKLGVRFAKAMGQSREGFGAGKFKTAIDNRMLIQACTFASDATAKSVLDELTNELDALILWNPKTGDLLEDSVKAVKSLKAFITGAI